MANIIKHSKEQNENWMKKLHSNQISAEEIAKEARITNSGVKMRYRMWRLANGIKIPPKYPPKAVKGTKPGSVRGPYKVAQKSIEIPLVSASSNDDHFILIVAKTNQLKSILGEINANR